MIGLDVRAMRERLDMSAAALCPTIPLLSDLEISSLVASGDFGMDGLRRAITLPEDNGVDIDMIPDSEIDQYETESLQLSDPADICKMESLTFPDPDVGKYGFPSTITESIIINDRSLNNDDDITLAQLTSVYDTCRVSYPSPQSDSSFDHDGGSDGDCSDSGVGSSEPEQQWETYVDTHNVDGPLPTFCATFINKPPDSMMDSDPGSDSADCGSPSCNSLHLFPTQFTCSLTPHHHQHQQQQQQQLYTLHYSSLSHDFLTSELDANNNEVLLKMEPGVFPPPSACPRGGAGGRDGAGATSASAGAGGAEKSLRKKPGRKKGQVSKVLHLWEFIRDLLSNPDYCPRIIHWENEEEGVFRVLQSSEVARLWGEKKKNKKTMTYEKLSRSLRYSRKEGYFDSLPKNQGYPKKLCFKFGPKSHGWREYGSH